MSTREDDLFCYYCHKQYKTTWGFKRHIIALHGVGLAATLDLLTPEEEAERQRVMAENGESDDPRGGRR